MIVSDCEDLVLSWATNALVSALVEVNQPALLALQDPALMTALQVFGESDYDQLARELVRFRFDEAPMAGPLQIFRARYREAGSTMVVPTPKVRPDQLATFLESFLGPHLGKANRKKSRGGVYETKIGDCVVATEVVCGGNVSDIICSHDVWKSNGTRVLSSEHLVKLWGINHGVGWNVASEDDMIPVANNVLKSVQEVLSWPWADL